MSMAQVSGGAVALAIAASLAVGGERAHAAQVQSAPLAAHVERSPWGIQFVDGGGRSVLEEHPGRAGAPSGSVGFEARGVWRHATRALAVIRSGRSLVATLATTDPDGRRLRVKVSPAGRGVMRFSATVVGSRGGVTAIGIGFKARRGERYLGFGERSDAVDQRGRVVESYVGEGPYQPEERPVIAAVTPPWGFQPRDDATYFPIPWLLSTRGYGVLVDNTETSYFRLGTDAPGAWSVEVRGAPPNQQPAAPAPATLRLRVFAGPEPATALRRYTAATGRQPPPAAPWYFGPWLQPTGDEQSLVTKLTAADAPLSVAQTYLHYLPCGDQQGRRAEQRERTARFHGAGLAVTTYFNPMLCTSYQPRWGEAVSQGALTKTRAGAPYVYRYSTSSRFLVGQFDFSALPGRRLYEGLLGEAVADGYDGWMEDFGEYTPLDSRSANGMSGTEMHNLYPVQYHCAAQAFAKRAPRPLGRFIRSGFTGVAPCAQIVWGGDPTVDWGFDGLQSAVTNGVTMGLSGISTWGSDIGGFFAFFQRALTPELLKRWVQFGAVSGVMRTQANGIAVPSKPRPQVWDADQLPNWRRYAKLRTQLYPYLVAADAEYRRSGMPIMQHLALTYPGDVRAAAREDQFLFGPDLLAAPVVRPGATERSLYLPSGRWVDLWRSVTYQPASGGLRLARARLLGGRRTATVPAPLEELPLLVRAGAALALLPPEVDTLSSYGRGGTAVRLRDRRDRMDLLAFPRGRTSSRFLRGERLISREGRGGWRLSVLGKRERSYSLQASLVTLRRRLVPCRLRLDGRRLRRSAWRYDSRRGALAVRFRTRSGTLTVERC
jgi:alpha-glucosidase (family GH31 glycosyl hydrolase)